MNIFQPVLHAPVAGISPQVCRLRSNFINLVERLLKVCRGSVSEERNDDFTVQIVAFKERTDNHCRIVPPDGKTDENYIIVFNIIGQGRHGWTPVVVGFVLDAVTVIIGIGGVWICSLDTEYIGPCG